MTNVHALTGAYVLDALDDAERAEFEAHLATCSDCQQEVAGLREATELLGRAVSAAPPDGLRERVLAQAAATAQSEAAPSPSPSAAQLGTQSAAPQSASAPPAGAGRGRAPAWRRWPAAAAAAAVLVVGGAVGGTLAAREHRADQAAAQDQAHMMRIATAPDAVSHDVALGRSHVVASAEMGAAALVGEDVPMPTTPGMAYQLWMVHADGSAAPGPTFVPDGGEVLAFVEGDLSAVAALTITEEPMSGSPAPSGDPVALVEL